MIMRDLHTHTVYSDGNNTPEEMVEAAIRMGMDEIGFSDHSFVSYDPSWCMAKERTDEYRVHIGRLKEAYKGKIRILCGIEQDYYSDFPAEGFDYVIGSVHAVRIGDEYVQVDHTPEHLQSGIERLLGGDVYRMAELYFGLVADVVRKTRADVIGHFDLIRKFNRDYPMFDENHPRYVAAATAALDALLPYRVPFEINTGAISRGYQDLPYPDARWIAYIKAHGGRLFLTGDSHAAGTLCYQFDRFREPENM